MHAYWLWRWLLVVGLRLEGSKHGKTLECDQKLQ
jgi:hypothetical protein